MIAEPRSTLQAITALPAASVPALTSGRPVTHVQPAAVTPAPQQSIDELQRQVFELVKTRVLESIGKDGNWTIEFRRSTDTDTFFSDTMADMIAWDVAHQLVPPTVPSRPRFIA